jgi:cold shock CspA family protein
VKVSIKSTGRVAEYDEHAGFGWIEDGGGRRYWFHCTAIADGSRSVPVGAAVSFDVVAGHLGRWEAGQVREATPA